MNHAEKDIRKIFFSEKSAGQTLFGDKNTQPNTKEAKKCRAKKLNILNFYPFFFINLNNYSDEYLSK
jgi:hypothetical protein